MLAALIIPASIDEIIQRYDASEKPFTEFDVSGALGKARAALVEPSAAENLGAWAEVLAFGLANGPHLDNPWNTYFGPMGSGTNAEGEKVYFPSIEGTPSEVVQHWASRARSLKHPFLKARYADLAWDMSGPIGQRKRDVEDARIAIDSYIDTLPLLAETHDRLQSAIRALDLAALIADQDRTNRARIVLMELHRETIKAAQGMWWYVFDRLIDDKSAGVSDAERGELVVDLEALVTRFSDPSNSTSFDPNAAKDAARKLITYYNRGGSFDDIRRLHQSIAKAFEHAASLGDAMLGAAFLQTAMEAYRDGGLPEESRRVRILMQKRIGDARDEMKSVGTDINIKKDDMEKFLDAVVVDDLGQTFVRIASEFLLKRNQLEQAVRKTLEEAPLFAHLSQTIMADDHVAAKIGSVQDDPFGRLFHQAKFSFSFSVPWLAQAFQRLFERHEVVPEHFVGWANRHKLFDDMGLLLEGVRAWFQGDHVKAVHVLVPQIERALRKIADQVEIPVTKAHPKVAGTSVAIGLGDILYSAKVIEALGPNVTLHMQALYSDPRGLNLRNEIAHGLLDTGAFHGHVSRLIIHTLLVLGLWKEFGAKRGADRSAEEGE